MVAVPLVGVGIWIAKGRIIRAAENKKIRKLPRKLGTKKFILAQVRKKAETDQLEAKGAQEFAEKFVSERGGDIVASISAHVERQLKEAARRAEQLIGRPHHEADGG